MDQIQKFKDRLEELGACYSARAWVEGKTAKEAWEQCERGDWLLWWAFRETHDIRSLTLAKARCAKLVIHLMKDQRSINAVHVAEQFGLGLATEEELMNAASDAYAVAFAAAVLYAANAAVCAARSAVSAAYAAADAYISSNAAYAAADASAYDSAANAAYASADVRTSTLKQCAEIIREIIKPNFIN